MTILNLKVQRPIITTEAEEYWLIYNEAQTLRIQIPPSDDMREFMGDAYKIYIRAEIEVTNGNGNIIFLDRISDQEW